MYRDYCQNGVWGLVVVTYLGYGWYTQYDPDASWQEKLFGMPQPVLWTPRDVDTGTDGETGTSLPWQV
ncbi:hypothetical protein ACYJ1Y_06620 [Natrialbaceae archaeon A-gly3]